jgi:membrane associated rhomboid family serine protease
MNFPPLTIKLLWATVIAMMLPLVLPKAILLHLVLWPIALDSIGTSILAQASGISFMPWQLATHVLVLDIYDLFFVGLTLAFFGSMLENIWGPWRYGQFLLACVAGSGIGQLLLLTACFNAGLIGFTPAAGADGVMFGILFAAGYLYPHQQVNLIIPPVSMELRWLVLVFGAIKLVFALSAGAGLVAFGFLAGVLGAWLHIRYWQGKPPFGRGGRKPPPPKPKPRYLRSVN